MQQTINLAPVQERTVGLREAAERLSTLVKNVYQRTNVWLDSHSEFYSRMIGEDMSWRQAIRGGVLFPLSLFAGVVCIEAAPVVSLCCIAATGWVTHRMNAEDDRTTRKNSKKKGA